MRLSEVWLTDAGFPAGSKPPPPKVAGIALAAHWPMFALNPGRVPSSALESSVV